MKIAHITDLHLRRHLPGTATISKRLSRRMPDLFALAVSRISAESPDLLVLSGDLLDFPMYGLCNAQLLEEARCDLDLIAAQLKTLHCPCVVLPGNHDPAPLVRDVFAGAQEDFDCAGFRVVSFFDSEVENNVPQRLGAEREKFLAVTAGASSLPQIHVQHYIVWPPRNEGYPHTYREHESMLATILESRRVRMVLSGHYHPGSEPVSNRGTIFAAPPAFCDPPHRWWTYDLTEDTFHQCEHDLADNRSARRKVVFLDRDGTLSPCPSYRAGPEDFELLPHVGAALARLRKAGFALVVVSSQSAVGAGFVTVAQVGEVNDKMARLLMNDDVEIDGVYCSYHYPDAIFPEYRGDHPDSKPNPGMLLRAADELHLDLGRAFIVGDREGDLLAGRRAGVKTILVRTGEGRSAERDIDPRLADAVVDTLSHAADWILAHHAT